MSKVYKLKVQGTETAFAAKAVGMGFWRWNGTNENPDVKRFRVDGPIKDGPALRNAKFDTAPRVVEVTQLESGLPATLLVHKVLESKLTENYSNDSYVGRCFAVTQRGTADGKRYKDMDVVELVPQESGDEEPSSPPPAPAKKKK
jgi:hypothetical protein